MESLHLPRERGGGNRNSSLVVSVVAAVGDRPTTATVVLSASPASWMWRCFLFTPGVDQKPGSALVSSFVILNTKTVEVSLFPSAPRP